MLFRRAHQVLVPLMMLMAWGIMATSAQAQDAESEPAQEEKPESEPESEPAPASEPEPEQAPEPAPEPAAAPAAAPATEHDWNVDYERGMMMSRAGAITGAAGVGAVVIGAAVIFASDTTGFGPGVVASIILVGTGAVGVLVGPPLMAGGSLRANHALNKLGYDNHGPALGYVTWGLWGGSMVVSTLTVDSDTNLAGLPFLASYVTGAVFAGQNKRAYSRRVTTSRTMDSPRTLVRVMPIAAGDTRGMMLTGTF